MAYDLLIKNGRIIDGSGRPAHSGRRAGGGTRNGRRARLAVAPLGGEHYAASRRASKTRGRPSSRGRPRRG